MKNLLTIIFCWLLFNSYILCQNDRDGLYFDVNIMSANDHTVENIIIAWNPYSRMLSEKDNKKIAFGMSFGFSGKINLSKIISINYRPGISISSGYYGFLDFGTALRFQTYNKFFSGIGIVSKLCITPREGNMHSSKPRGESFEYSVYGGYEINNKISLLLSINDTINDEYGEVYSNSMYTKKYVYWIIKLGLEYKL